MLYLIPVLQMKKRTGRIGGHSAVMRTTHMVQQPMSEPQVTLHKYSVVKRRCKMEDT